MRIINLVENTPGAAGCVPVHGLSFYIETRRHRLLMDAGPSEQMVQNACALGVDLTKVDTVILSHGHYDHANGLTAFAAQNPEAKIYLRRTAEEPHFSGSAEEGTLHDISMDLAILSLPGLVWVEGEVTLDEELSLFGGITGRKFWPESNRKLTRRFNGVFLQDSFAHEQCLVIREPGNTVLLSGCAHNGILNILDRFRRLYGGWPDAVISGFHMKKSTPYTREEEETICATARQLCACPSEFYTCHCTGLGAYERMKAIMGEQLHYVHCGEEIKL